MKRAAPITTLIVEREYAPDAVRSYERFGPVQFWHKLSPRARAQALARAEILVVRLSRNIDARLMGRMPRLKIIATSTTGLNHIDVRSAEERGIRVISLRGHTDFLKHIPSTAEETMALILALLRRVPWAFRDVLRGHWRNNAWIGHELKGKTLALIGVGRLGKLVAGYARAFGMSVVGVDPHVTASAMRALRVKKVALAAALSKADIVSLHVPFEPKTKAMFGRAHFRAMKKEAVFINTARAELIQLGSLYEALAKRWIAGAAIDVLDNEEASGAHLKRDPLARYAKMHDNLIILPHVGGTTFEAMETTQVFLAGLVERALRTL